MTTATSLISRSLRLLGAIGAGESPTTEELSDGLIALNAMIDSWKTQRLEIFAYQDISETVTGASCTFGGTSPTFAERPLSIENLFVTRDGNNYPVELVDQDRFYSIPDRTTIGDFPSIAYYEPSFPQAVMHLYPVTGACELHVVSWVPLSGFVDQTTDVPIPPGYDRAIAYNLAIEISPEYQLQPTLTVQQIAMESLANIKRANKRPIISYTEIGMDRQFGLVGAA